MPTDGTRAVLPGVDELRRVVQPPEVLARPAEHWTAGLYLRRVSVHVTRQLLRAGATADRVTGLMIATGVCAGLALLVPGPAGALLAVALGQLQMLWDCCDGEVARWNRRQSARGVLLDKLGHYGAELVIAGCLGFRAATGPLPWAAEPLGAWGVALGAALAALVVLNRALNDMVHASRAVAGLPPLDPATSRAAATPRPPGLARLRRAARLLPVHRAFHSVELTLLVGAAAVVDLLAGGTATPLLLVLLAAGAAVTVVGHAVAVVTSGRLVA